MFRYPKFAIAFTSLYLLVFALFIVPVNGAPSLAGFVFVLSPVLVIWMTISILKDNAVPTAELEDNDQWGYEDRQDIRPVR